MQQKTQQKHQTLPFQVDQDDFIVLQMMTAQEQLKLTSQRKEQLTQFYTTNKPYEISSWYWGLQQFTFQSKKIQLKAVDCYVLYWLYYNEHDLEAMEKESEQMYKYYLRLIGKIDQFLKIQCKQFTNNGEIQCFMKLATRSPKDLGYKYSKHQVQQISSLLTEYLKKTFPNYKQVLKAELSKQFINQIYRFFLDLSKKKLKIKNAIDFITVFSASERIIIDIADFSFLKENVFSQFSKNNFERAQQEFVQLWSREWRQFQWFEQLRCFFKGYNLTAITQYDQRCYFSQLQCREKYILGEINKFLVQLRPSLQKIQLSEGVMDLVLFGLSNKNKHGKQGEKIEIKMIEINVFNRNSRASLFSWDSDYALLTGEGQRVGEQVQIRILKQPKQISKDQVTRLMGMIQKGTEQIIQRTMNDMGITQLWNKYQ